MTPDAPAPGQWMLPGDARVLVASDMHLGDHDPALAGFFLDALDRALAGHDHLVLLGDLFEAWSGDDTADAVACRVIDALAALAPRPTLAVMRGNRDFLLDVPVPEAGAGFAARTGARMLDDPTVLGVGPMQVLLSHGDAWCTSDTDYMAFRAQTRSAGWQQAFLAQPPAVRTATAAAMRRESLARQAAGRSDIGDVDPRAVEAALARAGVDKVVHGHTHRPGHHQWSAGGRAVHRWVLPDWDARAGRGGFISIDASGVRPMPARAGGDTR